MSGSQMAKAKEDAAAIMKQKQAACMPPPQVIGLFASAPQLTTSYSRGEEGS